MGPRALRRSGMDVPAGLSAGPQGEDNPGVVQVPLSAFHHICGMATVLARSQSDGLKHLVHFGGQGLCQAPQKFGVAEAIAATGMESNLSGGSAARGRKFHGTFEALYRC